MDIRKRINSTQLRNPHKALQFYMLICLLLLAHHALNLAFILLTALQSTEGAAPPAPPKLDPESSAIKGSSLSLPPPAWAARIAAALTAWEEVAATLLTALAARPEFGREGVSLPPLCVANNPLRGSLRSAFGGGGRRNASGVFAFSDPSPPCCDPSPPCCDSSPPCCAPPPAVSPPSLPLWLKAAATLSEGPPECRIELDSREGGCPVLPYGAASRLSGDGMGSLRLVALAALLPIVLPASSPSWTGPRVAPLTARQGQA